MLLAQLLFIVFVPPIYNTIFMLVREKEVRMKETMKMMGMTNRAYWLSWYAYYSLITLIICILIVAVMLINVLDYSNSLMMLFMLIFYSQAIFA